MRSFAKILPIQIVAAALLVSCGGGGEPSAPAPAGMQITSTPWVNIVNGVAFRVTVQVVDAHGGEVAVAGLPVHVALTVGGGSLAGTTTLSTDDQGVADFTDLVLTGAIGSKQLTVSSDSLPSITSPVFTLKVGAVASLTLLSGDSQQVVTHDTLAIRPVAVARDASANPVPGAVVVATVVQGGGLLIPAVGSPASTVNYVADVAGQVRVRWQAGAVGPNRVTLAVSGRPDLDAEVVHATAGPGAPHEYATVGLLGIVPVVDATYDTAARVTVTDQFGNPVPGAPIRFFNPDSATSTETLLGATGVTDGAGQLTLGAWRVGTVRGTYRISAGPPAGSPPVASSAFYDAVPDVPARIIPPLGKLLLPGWAVQFQFKVSDRFGNGEDGIPVTTSLTAGTGTLGQLQPTTNFDGVVTVEFTAPGTAGTSVVHAVSSAIPDSSADVSLRVVAPTAVLKLSGDSQVVQAGETPGLPWKVRMVDSSATGVPGVPVWMEDENLQAVASAVTDSLGEATFVPPAQVFAVGYRTFAVRSLYLNGGIPAVTFKVKLVSGPPAEVGQLEPFFGDTIVGDVAQPLDTVPMVYVVDAHSLPVEGAVVHFSTTQGHLLADSALTNAAGLVPAPGWVLDTVAGLQHVTVTAGAAPPGQLTVKARPGPATQLTLLSAPTLEGYANERIPDGVAIEGRDRYGNLAAGRHAVPSVASGDATPIGGTLTLSATGRVYSDQWTLGAVSGSSVLRLTVDSAYVDVTASAIPPSPFNIVLRGVPAQYAGVFNRAAYEWRRRITADIPDVSVSIAGGQCAGFQQALSGNVDDLVIDVSIGAIDGPGGILGGATPCFVRTTGGLPLLGVMQFDDADLQQLAADGTLGDVITHEMGHVLGVGSLWASHTLVQGAGGPNPVYVGPGGRQGWADIGGGVTGSIDAAVENTGGSGTRDVHWREFTVPSELMTGYLSAAVNPMSALTIKSLTDLGYTVDATSADPYTIFTAPPATPGRRPVRINDLVGAPKFTVDRNGKVRPIP